MIPCKIYHSGLHDRIDNAYIFENKVLYERKPVSEVVWWGDTECPKGHCQFVLNGKWGFFNAHTGDILIQPKWDFASPFYGGFSRVGIGCIVDEFHPNGGKYGFINIYGETIIPCIYDKADNCSFETAVYNNNHEIINNYVIVYMGDKAGIIDMTGTIVSDFIFDEIYHTSSIWYGYIGIHKKYTMTEIQHLHY